MILQVTDGTTTVDLDGSQAPVKGAIYFPKAAERDEQGNYLPVEEEADVLLDDAVIGLSNILTTINALEMLFGQAYDRKQSGVGARVYVEYTPTNGATSRAEIMGGSVEWSSRRAERMVNQAAVTVRVTVRWVRAACWDGPRTQIPISNANGSNNTSGLTVSNQNERHIRIAASGAATIGPARVELRLKNTAGAARGYRNIYVFTDKNDISSLVIQGESRQAGYGSVVNDGTASNGQYLTLSVNGTLLVPWTLSTSLLSKTAGGYVRLLAKFMAFTPSANIYVRAYLKDATGLITLARTPYDVKLKLGAQYVQDLGALPFPPGGYSTGSAPQTLVLAFRTDSLQTIGLDFILPAPTDSIMRVEQLGNQVNNNEEVVIDGLEELTYFTESGANHQIYGVKDEYLRIWPGKSWLSNFQRIWLLWDGVGVNLSDTVSAKLYYRPLKLVI